MDNTKNLELPYGVILSSVNSLSIDYNGHMASYMTIQEYYEECLDYDIEDWISITERALAIENNSVWNLHWYPTTPIGSYKILCYNLENGLKALQEIKI